MNYINKWLAVSITLSLIKIGGFTTPATVVTAPEEPVVSAYDIMNLIEADGADVIGSMIEYIKFDDRDKKHRIWMAALKEPGKDNELWLCYYLMNFAVRFGYFVKAKELLEVIVTSSNNRSVLLAIIGGGKWEPKYKYRSLIELMYAYSSSNTLSGDKRADYNDLYYMLFDIYSGPSRLYYNGLNSATMQTQFTSRAWTPTMENNQVDRLKIMLRQIKKTNPSQQDWEVIMDENRLYYIWQVNGDKVAWLKVLIEENMPMFRRKETTMDLRSFRFLGQFYIRKLCYNESNQKLRAKQLDLMILHDFGDDRAIINEKIPDFEDISISMAIKDETKQNDLHLFFMNPNIGYYKSKWILEAIKHANTHVLWVLLQERVPLPSDQDLADAIEHRKETTKTAQEYNNMIDKYRQFYDPVTRLCIEGPKMCKQRVEEDYTWRNTEPIKIEKDVQPFKFKAYDKSGNLTYSASGKSECKPFDDDYEEEYDSEEESEDEDSEDEDSEDEESEDEESEEENLEG